MVNDEIAGGLKSALERGESLKRAMMTFYNSGYKKEEIEEAARAVNALGISPAVITVKPTIMQPVASKQVQQVSTVSVAKSEEPFSDVQLQEPPAQVQQQQQPAVVVKQKVSNYGNTPKDKALIFILVGVLVFLVGALLAIFIFKDELISFFSSFFG
jgi:hypothetical protein